MRIGNLELRDKEIVLWSKNQYYCKIYEMISEGWEIKGLYLSSGNTHIQLSIFDLKETCIVIAFFDNDDDGVSIIHPVGERLLELNKLDRDNFFKLYERYRNDRRY